MNGVQLHVPANPVPRLFDVRRSMRQLMICGLAVSALLVFGLGGWAVTTELAGAIIAQGHLIVESSVKKVQHPTGGVVGELLVREGDHVHAGQILLKLDQTQTLASLDIIRQSIDELSARQARDEAERDGLGGVDFPASLRNQTNDPRAARLMADEQALFAIRRAGRDGQKAQLNEQIAQLREQAAGFAAEIEAKKTELRWNTEELKGVQQLWDKKLVQVTRLTSLQRDAARLQGEEANFMANLAETRGRSAEIKLKILQIDADLRAEDGKELSEIRGKLSELREKEIASLDQLRRIDLRAPQDGFVHQLAIHTVGGVVTAGEPVMLIVPDGDALTVEGRIQPSDIDQVHLGQPAVLRFPGLSQRTTPEIDGNVTLVSADLSQDEKTGASYYTIRVAFRDSEAGRLGQVKLMPGMPVESFIQTKPRTVMSFLVKPMRDQIEKAFRER